MIKLIFNQENLFTWIFHSTMWLPSVNSRLRLILYFKILQGISYCIHMVPCKNHLLHPKYVKMSNIRANMWELMKMATCETQQMLPTFLLMTSTYPCKVLVVIHNVSMQILKYTTESFKTWLYQVFFTVINMKTNFDVQKKHQLKYIDANHTLN